MMRRQHTRVLLYSTIVILATVPAICLPNGRGLITAASSRRDEPLWQEIDPGSPDALRSGQQPLVAAGHYKAFQLNETALENLLANAPMEFSAAAKDPKTEIALPTPDGSLKRFRFVESPVMAPELAAQFPEIRTYQGWGIDDPTVTTRFARTSVGFHAIVLSPEGSFYVAPLSRSDTRGYASYLTRDAWDGGGACFVGPADSLTEPKKFSIIHHVQQGSGVTTNVISGGSMRTFRLAVAATGEYTQASGGTVASAMANITTTINNVNAIYQNDMSVRLMLVANNSSIVFQNANLDPFQGPNLGRNLNQIRDENQQLLDGTILQNNYDLGHVFDLNDQGGVARLSIVCSNGEKARGTSGQLTTVAPGTSFDLMVAHEIGHQFGADHTFNGTQGSCGNSGQLNNDTAYEPGSGSTIMAYPGLCGSDNIQGFRNPYFHGMSLAQMTGYIDSDGGCATSSNTNNTPPDVTPPFPSLGYYLVPGQTPFTLTASATDAEDPNLTFCWEQVDHGSPGAPTGDRGDNPLFRSFPPSPNPTRTFPQISDVLSGTWTLGETPPTALRMMTFIVTARDNHPSGGGFDQGAVQVSVCGNLGPFVVTQPALGTQAREGSLLTVRWDVAGTDARPISASSVRILLSLDDGQTFPTTLSQSASNAGSFSFVVPHANTPKARIKVEAVGNIFFNISPAFTIIPKPTITVTGNITITQGCPAVRAAVATVADERVPLTLLTISPTLPLPSHTVITFSNNNGVVWAEATAECGWGLGTHRIRLTVTNTAGLSAFADVDFVVNQNRVPTLGTYNNVHVVAGQTVSVSPSAPPSDPDGNYRNITASVVVPSPAPSSVTPLVDANGRVNILTTGSAPIQTYQIQVVAYDNCNATATRDLFVTVDNSPPQIVPIPNAVHATQGGGSAPPIRIATVSDQQTAPGALQPSTTAPTGITVPVTNSGGTIMATATATCGVTPGTYSATLVIKDSSMAAASISFTVIVDAVPPPVLGTYLDSGVTVGGSLVILPSVAPSDPNNAVTSVTVSPLILPGGGQVTAQANGNITVNTVPQTQLNTYQVKVTAQDTCLISVTKIFNLTVRSASCVAEQATVFVADTANHRIQRFNGSGWNIIGPGTLGSGLGQFNSPESVVASPDGWKIYVADTGNNRIQWSQDGGGTWAVFASGITPRGLVLDRDGRLYVSDARDNRVARYSGGLPGTPIILAQSGSGAGRVSNPNGLAIDCVMNLYIADSGNNRILVIPNADSIGFPNTGTVLASSGAGLNPAQVTAPQGLGVDNAGHLFVADTGNDRVLMIATAPSPGAATALCTVGAALGQVRGPEGVTIAAFTSGPLAGGSSIIVSDTTNRRIQAKLLPAGSWTSLGGAFSLPSKIR